MIICITGTPGVGKSTIAKYLAKEINAEILNLERIAKKEKIVLRYDKKAKSYIVDETKLTKAVKKHVDKNKNYIVPNHLSQFISPKIVKLCIVLRLNPKTIERRLKKRNYSKNKIKENVLAEILDVCLIEALENKHKVHEIDVTKRKVKEIVDEIQKVLKGKKKKTYGKVEWVSKHESMLK